MIHVKQARHRHVHRGLITFGHFARIAAVEFFRDQTQMQKNLLLVRLRHAVDVGLGDLRRVKTGGWPLRHGAFAGAGRQQVHTGGGLEQGE